MKKIKGIVAIVAIMFLTFLYAHISKTNYIYNEFIDNSEFLATGSIKDKRVEQTFQCEEQTLDGIAVRFEMFGNVEGLKVHYSLADKETGKVVAEGQLAAEEMENKKFTKIPFSTVDKCQRKQFTFAIWVEESKDESGVGFFYQPLALSNTILYIDGNQTDGTLALKTYTNRFDLETFGVMLILIVFVSLFIKFLYRLFR